VRAAVIDMLNELGYSVLNACNADEALAILGSDASIDLLFTDVVMPGPIKTRELAQRARELQPGLRVLFTSGYTQNAIANDGRLGEDVHLLSKPYRRDELARKLRQLLRTPRDTGVPADDTIVTKPAARLSKPEGAPRKVLVVEDVLLIRVTTIDMLLDLGIAAVEAADGAAALALLESDPEIDMLLTDIGLPGMSGLDLVAEACQRRPGLRIVIATGYSTGPSEGALDGYTVLVKPFDLRRLCAALTPQGL
jgi:CheY-like chemotaxis protein